MDSENPQTSDGDVPEVTNAINEEISMIGTETESSVVNKTEESAVTEEAKPDSNKVTPKKKPKQPATKKAAKAKASSKSPSKAAPNTVTESKPTTETGEVTPPAVKNSAASPKKKKVTPKKTVHSLSAAGEADAKKSVEIDLPATTPRSTTDKSPTDRVHTPSTISSPPAKPKALFGRNKSVSMKTRFDITGDIQLLVSQGEVWQKLEDPTFTTRKQAIRQSYPNSRDSVKFENGSLSVVDGAKRFDEPKFLNRTPPSDNHDGPFERGNCKASQRDHLNRSLVLREEQPMKLSRARVETKPREKLIL